jgi:predicted dehydrogenase
MARKLKVGIVGTGSIWKTHLPGWQQNPHAELAAIADINPDALKSAGEHAGVSLRYEKAADLFNNPDIDIVDVCTANQYHAPLAIEALQAGKHVLCEKPLAPTPQDIKKMIAARNKYNKLLMTAQHYRFESSSQTLKGEIDQGVLGDVYHARCSYLRRSGAPTRPSFVSRKHSGGGPCIDIGVHILDLTLWFMGNPRPIAVSGITQDKLARRKGAFIGAGRPIPDDWDVEEFAAAFVRFDTGASLMLEVSWLLHHKSDWEEQSVYVYGTKAGAKWPSNEIVTSNLTTKKHQDIQLCSVDSGVEAHAAECVAFAAAVAQSLPSPVPAEQSLDVMNILDGVYRSAASGNEILLERH